MQEGYGGLASGARRMSCNHRFALNFVVLTSRVCAEFLALAAVFPLAQLKLCIFHVNRNVSAVVRRVSSAREAEVLACSLEKMTFLGCNEDERKVFFELVRLILTEVVPDPGDLLGVYSTETVIQNLRGEVIEYGVAVFPSALRFTFIISQRPWVDRTHGGSPRHGPPL